MGSDKRAKSDSKKSAKPAAAETAAELAEDLGLMSDEELEGVDGGLRLGARAGLRQGIRMDTPRLGDLDGARLDQLAPLSLRKRPGRAK